MNAAKIKTLPEDTIRDIIDSLAMCVEAGTAKPDTPSKLTAYVNAIECADLRAEMAARIEGLTGGLINARIEFEDAVDSWHDAMIRRDGLRVIGVDFPSVGLTTYHTRSPAHVRDYARKLRREGMRDRAWNTMNRIADAWDALNNAAA